ncbi:MAG: MFS transporter, partial [Flavobacteriales bacterium]
VAVIHFSNQENYTRSTSLYRLAINLGFSVGPAIGGVLATIDYSWVFRVDGMSSFLAGIALIVLLKPKERFIPVLNNDTEQSPFRDKRFMFLLVSVSLYAIAFFQLFSVMSLYYRQVESFSEKQIGVLLATNGLFVAIFEMFLIYKIEKKATPQRWIAIGCILLTIVYLLLYVIHGFWSFIFLIIVISFSEMLAMPFMNTIMNQCAHGKNKGHYAGLYVMSWSLAPILAPLLATQLNIIGGYPVVWGVFAALCVTAMLAVCMISNKR